MPIPIFWRLILGYLVILLTSVSISSYSIVQLGGLSGTARTALNTDNRLIAYQEKLTDAFLSEVRYAGRFIITHSGALHDELRQFKNDFTRYISEINSLVPSAEIQARLSRVEELHLRYHDLFDQEVRYIRAGQHYAESRYQQEKEKIFESALRELEHLKAQLQTNLHDKLEAIEKAARSARMIAAVATLLLLGLGIALSFVISNSITRPLSALRRRTADAAEDDSALASDFSRIPEIDALCKAISMAKRKVDESAEANTTFVHSITERLAIPLISLKKRLSYLKEEMAAVVTAEQKTSFEILADETERLIEHCGRLQPSSEPAGSKDFQRPTNPNRSTEGSQPDLKAYAVAWTKFQPRFERAVRRLAGHGYSLALSWNSISESIKTLGYGKAKKNEETRSSL